MPHRIPRSIELMSTSDTTLLLIDVQERLVPAIRDHPRVIWNIRRLIDGAGILGIPVVATEQYPRGLGSTVEPLKGSLAAPTEKLHFSCGACGELFAPLRDTGRHKILVAGIEAHVCVQQTVIDLLGDGYRVYVAADAISSRFSVDYEIALRRMDSSGATLTTTEAALFEWCEVAGTPQFKQISALARESAP